MGCYIETHAMNDDVSKWLKELFKRPNVVKRFSSYVINGYKFYTRRCEARIKTQENGVTLFALTPTLQVLRINNQSQKKKKFWFIMKG